LRDRPAPFSVRLSVITGPAVAGPDRESGGDIPGVNPGCREGVSSHFWEGAYPTMRSYHVG
jgi:hypothetical protein